MAETLLPAVLPPPLRDTILAQPDARVRQDIRDFVINQFFRRDVFVRSPPLDDKPDLAALKQTRLHKMPSISDGNLQIKTTFGEVDLQRAAFAEVMDALADGPHTIQHLLALPGMRRQDPANAKSARPPDTYDLRPGE